ncbi:hypothetical protein ES708_30232 [subsurface metagenome]
MTVNEKDLTENQKKAANCTLTYLGNGIYGDVGKQSLWDCYLERCREAIVESIVIPSL